MTTELSVITYQVILTSTAYHTCIILAQENVNLRKIYINLENHCKFLHNLPESSVTGSLTECVYLR